VRAALARYHARTYGRDFDPERFFITGSGMMAIETAVRMAAGAGDEVIVPTPTCRTSSPRSGLRARR